MPWKADPNKKATAMCPVCGKPFSYYKCFVLKHCSRACSRASKRTNGTCPTCGMTFEFLKAWPRLYCSRKCAGAATIGNVQGVALPPVTVACLQCAAEFARAAKSSQRFCSRPCGWNWRKAQTAAKKAMERIGKRPYGQPPRQRTCEECGIVFAVTATQDKSSHGQGPRRFCSRTCWNARMTVVNAGENSSFWRGGGEPYYGGSWKTARRRARKRDFVCQDCGVSPEQLGHQLDVHHIVPLKTFSRARQEEANALSNLVSLCPECHTRREWATNRTHAQLA